MTTQTDPEDAARADFYALFARLLYQGPDAALLAMLAESGEIEADLEDAGLAAAWRGLRAASAAAGEGAAIEYDSVFIGTGRAEVTPYASFYLVETGREKVLVELRSDLAKLGLARSPGATEPEDHVAALFDVMRHLIARGSGQLELERQGGFYKRYIERSVPRFCDAIDATSSTHFYRAVSAVLRAFISIESRALAMV